MNTDYVVVPYIHVHLDGLYTPPLLREVEGKENHKQVLFVDVNLAQVTPGEAVLDGQLVEAEDLT